MVRLWHFPLSFHGLHVYSLRRFLNLLLPNVKTGKCHLVDSATRRWSTNGREFIHHLSSFSIIESIRQQCRSILVR